MPRSADFIGFVLTIRGYVIKKVSRKVPYFTWYEGAVVKKCISRVSVAVVKYCSFVSFCEFCGFRPNESRARLLSKQTRQQLLCGGRAMAWAFQCFPNVAIDWGNDSAIWASARTKFKYCVYNFCEVGSDARNSYWNHWILTLYICSVSLSCFWWATNKLASLRVREAK